MDALEKVAQILRLIRNQPAGQVGRGSALTEEWSRVQTSILGYQRIKKGCGCSTFFTVVFLLCASWILFNLIMM